MKQILQSLRDGATEVAEVPCPRPLRGQVLIRTSRTLVSAGTERMLIEFGRAGPIGKARQQPERVRQVIDSIRTDGLAPTLDAVLARLDEPLPLGYCNVGTVLEAGDGVTGFAPGDRVASNGYHAEATAVPVNLCARIPDTVSDDQAVFTVVGAIALQGIRLVKPTLGEAVVVIGLGPIGLMAVQLLRAHGCRVMGLDLDPKRLAIAAQFGAETVDMSTGADPLAAAAAFSRRRGVDAVLIAADTTGNEPIRQAAQMCRKRGRIVLVGTTGLALSRADFYEKELRFQVSCSYGPGRYDTEYEQLGHDYPVGFVRWTEQRNFEAVLDMLGERRIEVEPMISHRFPIAEAEKAYELVTGGEASLGILITYLRPSLKSDDDLRKRVVAVAGSTARAGRAVLGFIGAGAYARAILAPAFAATDARLRAVASVGGTSAAHLARKFGFEVAATDIDALFTDPDINAVVIATRHDSHADLVCAALGAGKHVFAEKPLALTQKALDRIAAARDAAVGNGFDPVLTVGFNRRFAPLAVQIKQRLGELKAPKCLIMTVNAGAVPADHWVHDPATGGGRVLGEACHFIDLLRFVSDAPVTGLTATALDASPRDSATLQLRFADGSIGTIHYFANGNRAFPKERLEVFAGGRILVLDNFRRLAGHGWPGMRGARLWRQDKGQRAHAAAFVRAVQEGGPSPIPFDEIMEVSRLSIEAARAVGS